MQLEQKLAQQGVRASVEGERRRANHVSLPTRLAFAALFATRRGSANAHDLHVAVREMAFEDLPQAFDGYTILFMSDLHVAQTPKAVAAAADLVRSMAPDLAVLGGDYQTFGRPTPAQVGTALAPLLGALAPPDGVLALLGNHDSHEVADELEGLGARVLVNEWASVTRGGAVLRLLGLDDVHSFFTPAATRALHEHRDGFRIALVHTPELATNAAEAGFRLYLAGHTHGGQICLPGGRPIVTFLDSHRALATGAWRWMGMQGYTTTGVGSGSPPLRFNCRPEIALIRLRRAAATSR